jgi:hypothetical protein
MAPQLSYVQVCVQNNNGANNGAWKLTGMPGAVVHAYNPTYSGGGDREDSGS